MCPNWRTEYAKNVTDSNMFGDVNKQRPAPEGPAFVCARQPEGRCQELASSFVTARRFCDQHDSSLQRATGRSLP
jgi:hypothetical protein